MTRLVFAADLHLGAGGRLADQADAWLRVCNYATDGADGLVVAGDVFHRQAPTPEELEAFALGLDAAGCPIILEPGNHDRAGQGVTALEVISEAREWVTCCTEPRVVVVGDARVAMLPWTSTRPDASDLLAIARGLRVECGSSPSVLVPHWGIGGARLPNGALADDVLREVMLPAGELELFGFGVVLAGHIHKPQEVAPRVAYVGSLTPVDWSEADDEHGVVVWDSDSPRRFERVPIASRALVTIDLGALDSDYALEESLATLAEEVEDGSLVRVKYAADATEHRRFSAGALADHVAALGGTLAGVAPTIIHDENRRGDTLDDDATPLEQLQTWLAEQTDIPPEVAARMRDETARYVAEEVR